MSDTLITALEDDRWMLDNGLVRVTVDAGRGGDIRSVVLVDGGTEMLWCRDDAALDSGSRDDDVGFFDAYPGGVQELFPNAGPVTTVLGAPLPFHGEAARARWSARSDGSTLRLTVDLRRMPFSMERRITLRSDLAAVDVTTTVTNRSARPLPAHWGVHPAFSAEVTRSPAVVFGGFRPPHAAEAVFGVEQSVAPGAPLPIVERAGHRAVLLADGDGGTADLGYAAIDDGWFVVRSEATGLAVAMTWPVEVFTALWIWQECRGTVGYPWWGRQHIVGIEPHSSAPLRPLLDEIDDGDAIELPASGSLTASYRLTFARLSDGQLPGFLHEAALGARNINRKGQP